MEPWSPTVVRTRTCALIARSVLRGTRKVRAQDFFDLRRRRHGEIHTLLQRGHHFSGERRGRDRGRHTPGTLGCFSTHAARADIPITHRRIHVPVPDPKRLFASAHDHLHTGVCGHRRRRNSADYGGYHPQTAGPQTTGPQTTGRPCSSVHALTLRFAGHEFGNVLVESNHAT